MENFVLHKSETRGRADHGWLKSYHSFSFANYHDPERMHFGVLRVLNDDVVAGSMGFGTHPHDNMEIITIALQGDLAHKDSMGNATVIHEGDVQVMSAGTGIQHSEYNNNKDRAVELLQIWLFPNKRNVTPRYDQISLDASHRHNKLQQILSPNEGDEGVWIHQDAWFHLGKFEAGFGADYQLKNPKNGVYLFVVQGSFLVENQVLAHRDGCGFWSGDSLTMQATSSDAEILVMELPMEIN